MSGSETFVSWLFEMGYLDKEDVVMNEKDIEGDLNKVKEVAPRLYNMLMCMCNYEEDSSKKKKTIKSYMRYGHNCGVSKQVQGMIVRAKKDNYGHWHFSVGNKKYIASDYAFHN